jgi:hypothetical protein
MQADTITDHESFERWLNARPEETLGHEAAILTLRTALRVMPLVITNKSENNTTGVLPNLTYAVLRGTVLARVINCKQANVDMRLSNAARAAALLIARFSARYGVQYAANSNLSSNVAGLAAASSAARSAADSADFSDAYYNANSAFHGIDSACSAVNSVAHASPLPADFAADAVVWIAIRTDASVIERSGYRSLLNLPLWPTLSAWPRWLANPEKLRAELNAATNGHVWLRWYDRMLSGRAVSSEEEMLYADEALDDLWEKPDGYLQVSAWLAEKLKELDAANAIIDGKGKGPGKQLSPTEDGKIGHASAAELDNEGNNLKRINQLRPLALQCAQDLKTRLANNQFPELISATDQYLVALTGTDNIVDWGTVWGLGLILESSAKAAQREIADRLLPELEDPAKSALDSLLRLHGPLVLSTKDGNDLFEEEKKYRLPAEQLAQIYEEIEELVRRLRDAPNILREDAKATFELMASVPLDDSKPERSVTYVASTTKNALIVLAAGAVAASPTAIAAMVFGGTITIATAALNTGAVLLVQEAIKKSKPFAAIQATLTNGIDQLHDVSLRDWSKTQAVRFAPFKRFIIDNEAALLAVAEQEKMEWLKYYVELVIRHNKADPSA